MPVGVALAALGARGDDQGVGVLAVEHDEFLAVDDPAGALLLGGGGDILQVVARILLELRKREGLAAVDDARDMRGLLLGRTAASQEAAADHHGGQIRLQQQRLAQRLHHDHGLDRAGAEAAVVFRERQAEQPLFGELAPDRLAPAALLRAVFLARIEVVGVVQEPVDAFLEKPLLLGQIKIHVIYFPLTTRRLTGRRREAISSPLPACGERSDRAAIRVRGYRTNR